MTTAAAAATSLESPSTRWRGFARRLREVTQGAGVPGVCVGVVTRDGAEQSWAVGAASLEPSVPARSDHVFHLFSGTKIYTATALMLLVQEGRLSLDTSVRRYLPDLPLGRPVTIRQLASHSSGLPESLRGLLATHLHGEPAVSTAVALERYGIKRGGVPGRSAEYRNSNYAILGELISRVSGVPYEQFVTRRILDPLGSRTTFAYSPESIERAAVGYIPRWSPMRAALRLVAPAVSKRIYSTRTGGLVALHPYSLDTAAIGGLIGCVGDFLPLLGEMLDPHDRLLTGKSKREMLTLQSLGAAGIMSRVGVGLAWKSGLVGDCQFWNHEGGGAGFCSETRLYPRAGLGIVMLFNLSQSAKLSRVAHELCESLREEA